MPEPIINDQYTAARAYFLCVIGLLFIESIIRWPLYFLELRNYGRPVIRPSTAHWKITTYLHKLSTLPSFTPFITDHSLPTILRLCAFIGLNILWGYNSIEFSTDYKLYGWLTIANGGLALLMASRTNLFAIILRVPSHVLLQYHRWIGVATVADATAHFALNIQHDIKTDQLAGALSNRRIQVGIMAWIALCIMFVTSVNFIRRRWFEAFYYSHALFFVFAVGALIHATKGPEFLLPGLLLWGIDRAIRFANSLMEVKVQSVTSLPGGVTKFVLEGRQVSHPGQMAWIQIPHIGFLDWHPFTIASAPGDKQAIIAIRGLGNYTKRVQSMPMESVDPESKAPSNVSTEGSDQAGISFATSKQVKIRMDGPYGVGSMRWGQHPVTVLVAGGIGITPGIGIASHIVNRAALAPRSHPDSLSTPEWHIHMLWVVKDISHTSWFDSELQQLSKIASNTSLPVSFHVTINVTGRVNISDSRGQEESTEMQSLYSYNGPGEIVTGRPNLLVWFQDIKNARQGLDVVVNACGPRALIDDTRKAAAKVSGSESHFYVKEEVFQR